MIDFSTLQGLAIPEGVVSKIEDSKGNIIYFANKNDDTIVISVEKITSQTYANETEYVDEQFILLDIYPKEQDSVVNVTYGKLTKTIQFSGTNAQQVFFGTFNGVSDSVETPLSGTLTIEGGCDAFGCGTFNLSKISVHQFLGITKILYFGNISYIPDSAFGNALLGVVGCEKLGIVNIPNTVERIGLLAFAGCGNAQITIPQSVSYIGDNPFAKREDFMEYYYPSPKFNIDENNEFYKKINGTLFEVSTGRIICGSDNFFFPNLAKTIGAYAFYGISVGLDLLDIPEGITRIETYAFYYNAHKIIVLPKSLQSVGALFASIPSGGKMIVNAETPPSLSAQYGSDTLVSVGENGQIIVPKGCGELYKNADGWKNSADYIVEAS